MKSEEALQARKNISPNDLGERGRQSGCRARYLFFTFESSGDVHHIGYPDFTSTKELLSLDYKLKPAFFLAFRPRHIVPDLSFEDKGFKVLRAVFVQRERTLVQNIMLTFILMSTWSGTQKPPYQKHDLLTRQNLNL